MLGQRALKPLQIKLLNFKKSHRLLLGKQELSDHLSNVKLKITIMKIKSIQYLSELPQTQSSKRSFHGLAIRRVRADFDDQIKST